MPVTINASPANGIVAAADGSGVMKLQSNGVTTNALAWVNFNGTGTVAIRSAYNVSSITDNGTGDYTVNFTTATSDVNYAMMGQCGTVVGGGTSQSMVVTEYFTAGPTYTRTTSAIRFFVLSAGYSNIDNFSINIAIFGN